MLVYLYCEATTLLTAVGVLYFLQTSSSSVALEQQHIV